MNFHNNLLDSQRIDQCIHSFFFLQNASWYFQELFFIISLVDLLCRNLITSYLFICCVYLSTYLSDSFTYKALNSKLAKFLNNWSSICLRMVFLDILQNCFHIIIQRIWLHRNFEIPVWWNLCYSTKRPIVCPTSFFGIFSIHF